MASRNRRLITPTDRPSSCVRDQPVFSGPAPPSLADLYRLLFYGARRCLFLLRPPTFTAQDITSLCLTNRSTDELPRLISCKVLIERADPAGS